MLRRQWTWRNLLRGSVLFYFQTSHILWIVNVTSSNSFKWPCLIFRWYDCNFLGYNKRKVMFMKRKGRGYELTITLYIALSDLLTVKWEVDSVPFLLLYRYWRDLNNTGCFYWYRFPLRDLFLSSSDNDDRRV